MSTRVTYESITESKSMVLSYVLWLFLGELGVHRFYLGRIKTGLVQLLLSILGWTTLLFGIGEFFLVPLGIWLLIDIFLIPGMSRNYTTKVKRVTETFTSEN